MWRRDLTQVGRLGEAEHRGIAVGEPGKSAERAGRQFHPVDAGQRCADRLADQDLDGRDVRDDEHPLAGEALDNAHACGEHALAARLEGLTTGRRDAGGGQPLLEFDGPAFAHFGKRVTVPLSESALGEAVLDLDRKPDAVGDMLRGRAESLGVFLDGDGADVYARPSATVTPTNDAMWTQSLHTGEGERGFGLDTSGGASGL